MKKVIKQNPYLAILIAVMLGLSSWGGVTIISNAGAVAVLNQKDISINKIVEEKDKSMRAMLVTIQTDIRIIKEKM